jgi:beta-phosphoglucomutase-like phosphatase (HAD superfamily)
VAELVIFDCDGVLVDSDRISLRIQAERISALGLAMTYEDCVRDFLGLGMPMTLRVIGERLGRPVPEEWVAELDAAVRESFIRELTPVPGVIEALDQIEVPTCIASSGSHGKMRLTLGLTGMYDRFRYCCRQGSRHARARLCGDDTARALRGCRRRLRRDGGSSGIRGCLLLTGGARSG